MLPNPRALDLVAMRKGIEGSTSSIQQVITSCCVPFRPWACTSHGPDHSTQNGALSKEHENKWLVVPGDGTAITMVVNSFDLTWRCPNGRSQWSRIRSSTTIRLGYLFIPTGLYSEEDSLRPKSDFHFGQRR